jgi:uroporphyrinogen-III synthase
MKVIVTRPRLEAEAWVKQLQALQLDAVALPLIHIGAAANRQAINQAWANLHQYTAVMFVSSNAVRYFYPANMPIGAEFTACAAIKNIVNSQDKTAKPRMWATGPGTRDALLAQAVPIDLIDSPAADAAQFDSETLWNIVKHQVKSGDKVLIVRGRSFCLKDAESAELAKMNGRPWLADQLTAAGVQVDEIVSYERRAPEFDAAELALLRESSADQSIWLFSSSEAVANLCTVSGLDSDSVGGQRWSQARAIATHPRIAQAARDAGFGVVYESRPLLKDVVASIESLL